MREVVEKVKMSHRRVSAKDFMRNNEIIKARIRTVRNGPKEGVNFSDVTTLFQDPEAVHKRKTKKENFYENTTLRKIWP